MSFLFLWRQRRPALATVVLALFLLGLGGCVSLPDDPPPPPFLTGPLQLASGDSLSSTPVVRVPSRTRYASVASRAPFYGLMLQAEKRRATAPFGEFVLAERLPLDTVAARLFREEASTAAVLPGRWQARGTHRVYLDIQDVIVFAKDVRNTRCEPLVMLRASVVDASNRRLWHSGLLNNRPDDRINHDCLRLEHDRAYAAEAITAATRQVMLELATRMRP